MVEEAPESTQGVSESLSFSGTRVVKNAVLNSSAWIVNVILALLVTPFFVQKLTTEGYGIYALLTGLAGYYNLLDLGMGDGVIKYVAEYHAKSDLEGVYHTLNVSLLIQTAVGLLASVLVIGFTSPIIRLMHVPDRFILETRYSFYLIVIGFLLNMLSGTLASAFMGFQRYDVTSKLGVGTSLLSTLLLCIALFLGGGLIAMALVTTLVSIITFLLYYLGLKRALPGWGFPRLQRGYVQQLFGFSIFLWITRASAVFVNYIVRFLVGLFLGPAMVTVYVVPAKAINAVGGLLGGLIHVIFPYASEAGAQKNEATVQRIYLEGSRLFISLSLPLSLALGLFSKPLLSVWMGSEFANTAWRVLSLLAVNFFLASITTVPILVTLGLGYSRVVGLFSTFGLLAYALFVTLFTRWWGVEGTAIGLICGSLPGIALVIYETRWILHLDIWLYIRRVFSFHIPFLMASVLLMGLFSQIASPPRWVSLILPAGFLLAYFGLMLAFRWINPRGLVAVIRSF